MLLRAGISRDARTKVDRTPLHVACQEGHSGIVELLLRSGADIEAKDMVITNKQESRMAYRTADEALLTVLVMFKEKSLF